MPATFLMMLPNPPPRSWGPIAQKNPPKKRHRSRKPSGDTSKKTARKTAKRRRSREVDGVAKRKKKRRAPARGAGGKSKRRRRSTTTRRRRGRRASTGKARRSRRRRRNPSIASQINAAIQGGISRTRRRGRRRRIGGKRRVYRPSLRVGRKVSAVVKRRIKRAVGRRAKLLRSGAVRINPRRRRRRRRSRAHRRNPARRRRRVHGRRRRHYGRRRSNPGYGLGGGGLVSKALGLIPLAGGFAADRYLPDLVSQYVWSHDTTGWQGEAVGAAGTYALSMLLGAFGYRSAGRKLVKGMIASKAVKVAMYAKDKLLGPSLPMVGPRPVATAQRGMGSIVSSERMIASEGAQRLGDFVQLQGPIPRRDFAGMRGMRDYIEFQSPAAGAQAMAAQLATSQPFMPGPEEKF